MKPGGLATTSLVVLTVFGHASAAEIIGGAIRDAGQAQLVRTKTFGTGPCSRVRAGRRVRAPDQDRRWLTPKGRVIWHGGSALT